jgi:hypothetical protein
MAPRGLWQSCHALHPGSVRQAASQALLGVRCANSVDELQVRDVALHRLRDTNVAAIQAALHEPKRPAESAGNGWSEGVRCVEVT